MEGIEETLREYISREFVTDGTPIDSDTSLLDNEIIDSLGIFTLVQFIEGTLGIEVEPEDVNLENFESVRTIAKLVESRQK